MLCNWRLLRVLAAVGSRLLRTGGRTREYPGARRSSDVWLCGSWRRIYWNLIAGGRYPAWRNGPLLYWRGAAIPNAMVQASRNSRIPTLRVWSLSAYGWVHNRITLIKRFRSVEHWGMAVASLSGTPSVTSLSISTPYARADRADSAKLKSARRHDKRQPTSY